jgi:hypothetical protein
MSSNGLVWPDNIGKIHVYDPWADVGLDASAYHALTSEMRDLGHH